MKKICSEKIIQAIQEMKTNEFDVSKYEKEFDNNEDYYDFLFQLKYILAKLEYEEQSQSMSNKCYTCTHRNSIPGDCHSSCSCYSAIVFADEIGIKKGYFIWPLNFDPTWLDFCDSYEEKKEK